VHAELRQRMAVQGCAVSGNGTITMIRDGCRLPFDVTG
jgi:hypothetical protein